MHNEYEKCTGKIYILKSFSSFPHRMHQKEVKYYKNEFRLHVVVEGFNTQLKDNQ